jgi:hypothetical protein
MENLWVIQSVSKLIVFADWLQHAPRGHITTSVSIMFLTSELAKVGVSALAKLIWEAASSNLAREWSGTCRVLTLITRASLLL